ncbi:DUF805 domain-containing protein [Mesorhizobium sp.]|uniref:DUF805 domain-containing protein n=1 Tax=Mesorhizobium sp. TaxID=1871066 RepID=UPI00120955A3|nr:DUF805 domain-containing protein [Mesorhizobium sp.]TIO06560.1 MAG: DUF805 domain-containing protein [Mesorhizobium sp.]TIO31536.1 MAG: DUF805 domain-containing protein [Mesorhizobium sp.]
MRGEVLHYDEDQGFGFIAGADGNHYTFAREDLRREVSMTKGTLVEFQPAGGRGRDVFPARAQTASPPADAPSQASNVPGARQPQHFGRSAERSPVTAATGLWDYFWRGLTGNYFNFAHRARRKEYWGYCLFWTIALIVVVGIGFFIDDAMSNFDELPTVTVGLCGVFVLATIPPWIGLNVRRLHDIGLTGWLFLVVLIPTIGWLIILVFALVPTQARENQWGPVPAGVNHLS